MRGQLKTITQAEVDEVIRLHKLWWDDKPEGRKARFENIDFRASPVTFDAVYIEFVGCSIQFRKLERCHTEECDLQHCFLDTCECHESFVANCTAVFGEYDKCDVERTSMNGMRLVDCVVKYSMICQVKILDSKLFACTVERSSAIGCEITMCHSDRGSRFGWMMTGFRWAIWLSPDMKTLRIACQEHPVEKWREWSHDADEILDMSGDAPEFWTRYKGPIMAWVDGLRSMGGGAA